MLLESILRKTLGLKSHRVEKVWQPKEEILVKMVPKKRSRPICSSCGRPMSRYDTLGQREWSHVPLWGIPVTLLYSPRRGRCTKCGIIVEAMPWNRGKSPLSLPLIIVLATFAKMLAWEEVSRLFGVHWNTVRGAVRNAVEYGLANRETTGIIAIGVDEISRRKGHKYVTMVYDLKHMRLIWCGEGRSKETLRRFFEEWGEERTKAIHAVCLDMWRPYSDVIAELAPGAIMVFDKFHIIKHLLDAVDKVRREEAARLKEIDPELLKKTRYIWLKNPWNLTKGQKVRLSDLEKLNLKINRAYILKENFRDFWNYIYPGNAKKFLDQWIWMATHSRIEPMRDVAWMIRRHEEGILNYFKTRISNGAVEGMNRKAKVVSQRAYGYRTFATFQLALYHVMGDLPMPKTTHKFL